MARSWYHGGPRNADTGERSTATHETENSVDLLSLQTQSIKNLSSKLASAVPLTGRRLRCSSSRRPVSLEKKTYGPVAMVAFRLSQCGRDELHAWLCCTDRECLSMTVLPQLDRMNVVLIEDYGCRLRVTREV